MEQEAAYIEALRNVTAYRLMDDRLEMDSAAGGTTLIFARKEEVAINPDDLLGTAWQLASMNDSNLIEGSTITLAFHNEYQVSGHANRGKDGRGDALPGSHTISVEGGSSLNIEVSGRPTPVGSSSGTGGSQCAARASFTSWSSGPAELKQCGASSA